ncbi:armadillo-type protein [Coniella lustricola]|uniref:Armadillo-type protein n=1 Tax=Coniella lustricola TaxID=2025994 RepID=A0A2T3A948_9PEZI|nr:armadillo-type protein [Coniella lustricola]
MDPNEMRFRAQQSPRSDATTMNSLVSPSRNRLSQTFQQVQDPRSNLSRRFTTDSGRVPTLSSNIGPRGPDQEYQDMQRLQLIEKKRMEYEKILEQKRLFEAEMVKHEVELSQMMEEHGRLAGHQSEPTTPPEYRETPTGFPSLFSRPNRYSLSSLTSPPGLANRSARSGSVLASPQSGMPLSRFAFDDQLPSWSQQMSRRNSDEDEKEEAVRQDPTSHRSTNAYAVHRVNRYSMPVTKSRTGFYDISLDQANTTGFLFGDDDNTQETSLYTQTNLEDNFPTLVSRPNMNSISNEASNIAGRSATYRHSVEMKSIDQKFIESMADATNAVNTANGLAAPPKLQGSFSANDVPTLKTVSGATVGSTSNHAAQQHLHNHNASMGRIPASALPNRHSRELSVDGRDNMSAVGYQSLSSTLHANATPFGPGPVLGPSSVLHMSGPAASQGGVMSQAGNLGHQSQNAAVNTMANSQAPANYNNTGYFPNAGYNNAGSTGLGGLTGHINGNGGGGTYNHGVPLLSTQMNGLSLNGTTGYSPANYAGYGAVYAPPQPRDSQARIMQNRRQQDNEAMSRFNGQPLEAYGGSIYELCKDQHGCRYLQKQLENRDPEQVHKIWLETSSHVIELMTDPFGNYLCQKLFEYCNDDERTVLVQNAARDMVRIALNQHGTRALQKMIENISNDDQVQLIIQALGDRVVELIQDLNGNHVIQKCLNKLSSLDAQFIFDAVGTSCVEVGTHRHGCCVLQRCIDHASGDQKTLLIQRITDHAYELVQDPFGNYVVQYIIDLNESMFTEPLVQQFHTRIPQLSRHKFSSNVIEKCLRCASSDSKDMIVEELLAPGEIERLIRDSYANYVIQTALEHATTYMKKELVESIRPILPAVRQTPYGRKIQSKINAYDANGGRLGSGQVTPADTSQGQIPLRSTQPRALSNSNTTSILAPGYQSGMNGGRGPQAFPPSALITVPPPQPQRSQHFAPPQQFANRIAGPGYVKLNGAPGFGDGSAGNGMHHSDATENGEQNFF